MKKRILVSAEKLFLNADSRKSNANFRRFNHSDNLRPSALDSRKLALKDARTILLFFLFFMFILSGTIFADTIFLKNGTKFTGRTIRQDAEKVLFRIGSDKDGVDITFFSEQILRIDKAEVSSFISVPFGQGKQIEIPRPTFSKEPLLTEQVRSQAEKRQRAEIDEQAKTNTTQQEGEQSAGLPKAADSDLFLKQKKITEELMPLLNKEEKYYFSKINSMVKTPTDSAMFVLNNPSALNQDRDKLEQVMEGMPSQMEYIIQQLNSLQPPDIFMNFHKKYLENITLIKEAFLDMSKGDILNCQTKIDKSQNMNIELFEELSRILDEKKNKK